MILNESRSNSSSMPSNTYLGLDVGTKRIGVARGDASVRLAFPLETIEVDGQEYNCIGELAREHDAIALVVGYPRNQAGDPTAQTASVEQFVEPLRARGLSVIFQDESVTSVMAEQRLIASGKAYAKGDIDALAAALILQDYLERRA